MGWHAISAGAFNLRRTLLSGQVFRWAAVPSECDEFVGVLGSSVVRLRQDRPDSLAFRVEASAAGSAPVCAAQVADYFNAAVDLAELQQQWIDRTRDRSSDLAVQLRRVVSQHEGTGAYLRVLRQDPEECLMSFVCSQNNNVKRIALMIDRLCTAYGAAIGTVEGKEWYTFPRCEALAAADGLETHLRELGFGYRAPYIRGVAQAVCALPHPLRDLRDPSAFTYEEVLGCLTKLPGVGRKVADCVALFSLDRPHVVPVDTHIYRLAKATLAGQIAFPKTLTPSVHNAVQKAFVEEFGEHCGWAHTVMFHAELTSADVSARSAQKASAKAEAKSKQSAKKKKKKEKTEEEEDDDDDDDGNEEEQKKTKKKAAASKSKSKGKAGDKAPKRKASAAPPDSPKQKRRAGAKGKA